MSFDGEATAALAIFIVGLAIAKRRKRKTEKRRKRSTCVKPWLYRRENLSLYDTLLLELRFEIQKSSKNDPRRL